MKRFATSLTSRPSRNGLTVWSLHACFADYSLRLEMTKPAGEPEFAEFFCVQGDDVQLLEDKQYEADLEMTIASAGGPHDNEEDAERLGVEAGRDFAVRYSRRSSCYRQGAVEEQFKIMRQTFELIELLANLQA